ncbi:hypothetical protein ACFWJW_25140 [Streptomyces sp. NPDC127097]|uniref:hypothetical protein n=1 Tax=Streptomyces sp. NPDC127097 TaxID=3347136 RepID=UPI00364F9965
MTTPAVRPLVPRPVRWAAHAAPLTLLPSGLWRCAIAFGVPSGFDVSDPLHRSNFPGWMSLYLIGLSLVAEGLGLLTLGLVQPWGERVPRWVPVLGGRRIPVPAAVVPASLGAAAVTVITVVSSFGWGEEMAASAAPKGVAAWVMTAAYLPLLAWGPLLGCVTMAYWRRRRRTG